MINTPYFSIIIPTRNRPNFVNLALYSLSIQTFQNFEVIFCDNSDPEYQKENKNIISQYNFEKFNYKAFHEIKSMPDNWESGLDAASGKYVTILTDKSFYRKSALEVIYNALENNPVDIINYYHAGINYDADTNQFSLNLPVSLSTKVSPKIFNPKYELERRLNFCDNLYFEGDKSNLGKILAGMYSRDLIIKIKSKHGRLFHPFSCDYTSCALALDYANSALLYPNRLFFYITNSLSHGYLWINSPGYAKNYVLKNPSLNNKLNELPLQGLYTSTHNLCAYDYLILNRLGLTNHQLNLANLMAQSQADLNSFCFDGECEQNEQLSILLKYQKKLSIAHNEHKDLFNNYSITNLFRQHTPERLKRFIKNLISNCYSNMHFSNLKDLLDIY